MRSSHRQTSAFTLIELLVVVAIIALLISILLPSLQGARDQSKKAYCLNNMRSIGTATGAYSTEDRAEHAVPIHLSTPGFSGTISNGWNGSEWWWRTAQPSAFGGRSAQVPFPTGTTQEDGSGPVCNAMLDPDIAAGDPAVAGALPDIWGSKTRPLNRYILGSVDSAEKKKFESFHCPNDTGMPGSPDVPVAWMNRETSRASSGIPFYDLVGNSYRVNVAGAISPTVGSFTVGPWGHKLSSLQNNGRVIMYAEPMVYLFSRQDPAAPDPDLLQTRGWHKKQVSDNAAFADGSARTLRLQEFARWDPNMLNMIDYIDPNGGQDWRYFLRRGDTWQTDCYPVPGAFMPRKATANGTAFRTLQQFLGGNYANCVRKWPFRQSQVNLTE